MESRFRTHTIAPFYREDSKVLVLGSFPSVKSREAGFFYGHPQNRFWKMLEKIYKIDPLPDVEAKKTFLAEKQIAIWDSIASCTISGSSDSSIRDVTPNSIRRILEAAPIRTILCNGATSYQMYMKYNFPETHMEALRMPSTSPANAAWNLDRLCDTWKEYFPIGADQ